MEEGMGPDADVPVTGVTPELLDRLRPYLAESLMVLDHDWTIKANLAPPGGLIGRGLGIGLHTLEDMHPDDAVAVLELGLEAFTTQPGWQGSKFVRMLTGDGTYGRYEITAINRFDDPVIAGMVVRTREVPEDLTEEWMGERPASAVEMLAELLPLGVLLLDTRGRVVFANESACAMLDRGPEAIKRDGLAAAVEAADRDFVEAVLGRITASPGMESCTLRLVDARVQRVECRFSSEGQRDVTSVVVTMEDVTERHATQQDLEARAYHDPLTGLGNRSALHEALADRLAAEQPLVVAYLDLDGFKAVNDTWGHERGDQVLVAVAHALRRDLGPDRLVARLGGDEFVVLGGERDASTFGPRLEAIVAAVGDREGVAVTCSVGVAGARLGDSAHDVLRRADDAMYAAKHESRRPNGPS
ncbi:hypothetical protein BH10ACT1_BH10ACT1_34120 [soil metagenome]